MNGDTIRHQSFNGNINPGTYCTNSPISKHCGANNCVYSAPGFTGQRWYRPTRKRGNDEEDSVCDSEEESEDEKPCLRSVEPDLVVIDGRAFEVNGTMTAEQKKVLDTYYYADDLARMGPIPSEFDEFETEYEL
ncbi:hypothetical protein LIA77_07962 [Sarocladium implicatum]|nr:hypothetical protein LIA77_07962 [Sarocladium implicatum]